MTTKIGREIAVIGRLTAGQLQDCCAAVFGATMQARNQPWLIKRIQAQALGAGSSFLDRQVNDQRAHRFGNAKKACLNKKKGTLMTSCSYQCDFMCRTATIILSKFLRAVAKHTCPA